MNKNEIERRLEAAEKQNIGLLDEIKYLKEQLAKVQEDEIPDLPNFKHGESYWTVFDNFALSDERTVFVRDATEYNMFHTEAYAQEFADKCKLIAMMLHCKWYLDRDYVPDWDNNDEEKFYVRFYHDSHEYATDVCWFASDVCVCFSTEENAKKCADWLNKQRSKPNEQEPKKLPDRAAQAVTEVLH